MSKQAALTRLHERFTYKEDRLEEWQALADSGPVEGDCEDFALTLIKELEGGRFWRPVLKGDYRVYFCRVKGDGHAVLFDTETQLVADNRNREWRTVPWLRGHHYTGFERIGRIRLLLKLLHGWFKTL